MTRPYANDPATQFMTERIRDLSHRKSQRDIAAEAGFANPNMITLLKQGQTKMPLDRVPSLAKALECDPAHLMRLALAQAVGVTAANAITEVFGTPISQNELAIITEVRDASGNNDPRLTTKSRTALRSIFKND